MELLIELDRKISETLQVQIYEQIRQLILSRVLDRGFSLPSSRMLADDLHVSRNTVLNAYERLTNEGYLETRGTAGTFVTPNLPESLLKTTSGNGRSSLPPIRKGALAPLKFRGRIADFPDMSGPPPQIDMQTRSQWRHLFPAKEWGRLMQRRLASEATQVATHRDPAGHVELRQALAAHLAPARGIVASEHQILITNGTQESLNIMARLFVDRDTTVAVENPCYGPAAFAFESYGAKLLPVNVEEDGLDLDNLAKLKFDLIYTTPAHQFPTGVTMTVEQRQRLLELAWNSNAYIIEDDYDGDFRYDGPPLRSLRATDTNGCVIYLGSFSQTLGAGVRIGFMVLPFELIEPAIAVKSLLNKGNSWANQVVLADMIESGSYMRHLRRTRSIYLGNRNNLIRALKTAFDDVQLYGEDGGAHLMWKLPPHFPNASALREKSLQAGVGIYTTNTGDAHDFGGNGFFDRGVMLGYSSLSEKQVWESVSRIFSCVRG
ncbi:MAG: PLP-dependent aminotransferase family protein [Rhodospirillaceae bacterium]|jgi:GntR family transcriptional regulator / MocR family aminotransferase|nr:PLP-dependent aminotransferase family protein [Rhodospirillaceae bacterium]